MSQDPTVRTTVDQGVATITLDRPQRRNALDASTLEQLQRSLGEADDDDAVRAIVLTGTGAAFCAGLDLNAIERGEINILHLARQGNPWAMRGTPLIAAVNGPAITGGLEIALSADIIVASADAWFADTHAERGIVPFWGLTELLPAAVGARRATFMSLTGQRVSAAEGLEIGLVNVVVPAQELLARAGAIATQIASGNQSTLGAILALYRAGALGASREAVLSPLLQRDAADGRR